MIEECSQLVEYVALDTYESHSIHGERIEGKNCSQCQRGGVVMKQENLTIGIDKSDARRWNRKGWPAVIGSIYNIALQHNAAFKLQELTTIEAGATVSFFPLTIEAKWLPKQPYYVLKANVELYGEVEGCEHCSVCGELLGKRYGNKTILVNNPEGFPAFRLQNIYQHRLFVKRSIWAELRKTYPKLEKMGDKVYCY